MTTTDLQGDATGSGLPGSAVLLDGTRHGSGDDSFRSTGCLRLPSAGSAFVVDGSRVTAIGVACRRGEPGGVFHEITPLA